MKFLSLSLIDFDMQTMYYSNFLASIVDSLAQEKTEGCIVNTKTKNIWEWKNKHGFCKIGMTNLECMVLKMPTGDLFFFIIIFFMHYKMRKVSHSYCGRGEIIKNIHKLSSFYFGVSNHHSVSEVGCKKHFSNGLPCIQLTSFIAFIW